MELLPTGAISPKGKELEDFLNSRVKGQRRAVRYLREYMEIYWAGLRDPNRPIANLLFLGPSSVGKTQLAKALAEYMFGKPDRLTIISCSEYAQGHEVTKLNGSAPSYVGHGESAPVLLQWNLDRHHVEYLCETGEFFNDLIADQVKRIGIFEELRKALKKAIEALEKKIAVLEREMENLKLGYISVHENIKAGKDSEGNAKKIKEQMEKALESAMAVIKDAKENIKRREGNLKDAEERIMKINANIENWKKLKEKGSPEDRLVELRMLIATGDYQHKPGRKSIILWDEIEKAGSKLHNLLLPIMDEGKLDLFDPPDAVTYFNNAIIIFTSNLSSDQIAALLSEISNDALSTRVGFGKPNCKRLDEELEKADPQIYEMAKTEVDRFFPKEFVNRINKIVVFRPLDEKALREVVELRIEDRVQRQPVKFEIDPEVKDFLVQETVKHIGGGARLLDERIRQFIDADIAPLINSGALKAGDTVVVKLGKDKKLEFYKK